MKNRIKDVTRLNVPGGRFVEVAYDLGSLSVRMEDSHQTAQETLFAQADTEQAKARACMKRAGILRAAAWKLIREKEVTS